MVGVTAPNFTVTTVDGGGTRASLEGTLDVEQAGGFAPGAAIIQYGLPDLSDQSIIDGLSAILTDDQVDVVSMSFGSCELNFLAFWDGPFSAVDTVVFRVHSLNLRSQRAVEKLGAAPSMPTAKEVAARLASA